MKRVLTRLLFTAVLVAGCGGPMDELPVAAAPRTPPLQMRIANVDAGDGQTGEVATTIPKPLRVLVTRGGQPVSGIRVVWSTPGEHQTPPPASVTDAQGIASAAYTFSQRAGLETVEALFGDVRGQGSVMFTLISKAGPAVDVVKAGGDNQSVHWSAAPHLEPLTVAAIDRFGNSARFEGDVTWHVVSGPVDIGVIKVGALFGEYSARLGVKGLGLSRIRARVTGGRLSSELQFTVQVLPTLYRVSVIDLDNSDFTPVFQSWYSQRIPALDTVQGPVIVEFTNRVQGYFSRKIQVHWQNTNINLSAPFGRNESVSVTLTEPGEYRYFDPQSPQLTGTVVVK